MKIDKTKLLVAALLAVAYISIGFFASNQYLQYRQLAYESEKAVVVSACAPVGGSAEASVSSGDRTMYKNNQKQIQNLAGENAMKKYFKGDSDITEAATASLTGPVLLVILAAICIFGWITYIFCCVCECCCPPCKRCCACCRQEKPYTNFELYWPVILSAITLLGIVIVCIIGLTKAPQLRKSYQTVVCATQSVLNIIVFGDANSDSKWVGIQPLLEKLKDYVQGLSAFLSSSSTTFAPSQITNLVNANTNINTAENTFYTDYTGVTNTNNVYARDLDYTTQNVVSGYFGPALDVFHNAFNSAAKPAFQAIVDAASDLNTKGNSIGTDTGFQSALDGGVNQMQSITDQLVSVINDVDDFSGTGDDIFKIIETILTAIYAGFLGVACLAGVVIFLLAFFKWYRCRFLLHGCWCLFSLIMIITFLLASVFLALSIFGYNICDILYDMFSSREAMRSYPDLIQGDAADIIATCSKKLEGDGDILKEVNIDQQMNSIRDLQAKITAFLTIVGSSSPSQQAISTFSTNLASFISGMTDIRSKGYATYNQVLYTESTLIDRTTSQINALRTKATACRSAFTDYYVSDLSKCPSGTTALNPFANTPNSVCIYIGGDAGATATTSPIPDSTVSAGSNTRYTNCDAANNAAATTVALYDALNNVFTWRTKRNAMITRKSTLGSSLQTAVSNFNSALTTYQSNVNTYLTSAQSMLDKVLNTNTGILSGLNCLFFEKSLDIMTDSICASFMNQFFFLTQVLIALSFFLCFGAFGMQCAAMRYKRQKELLEQEEAKQGQNGAKVEPTAQ